MRLLSSPCPGYSYPKTQLGDDLLLSSLTRMLTGPSTSPHGPGWHGHSYDVIADLQGGEVGGGRGRET